MKNLLIILSMILIGNTASAQTTWQVCVEDPPSTTCPGKTGTFTPGNLTIQQGDMIEFTTTMVLLSGYSGTNHTIEFTGSATNNVTLPVSSNILAQVTTVTTPPFNTPGVFPMECTNFNHCILSEYSCTGYSVTVLSNCSLTASFTTAPATTVCTGEVLNFTNTSTGAVNYDWHLDEFTFATTQDAVLSFGASGSYDIELVIDDGAGCEDSVTVTINVDPESDAGDNDSLIFCNIEDSTDLNDLLNGDTGGFWEETTSSGQFNNTSGILNYNALTAGDYYFNYIVPGVGVCPNDTATMKVEINQEPSLTLNLGATPIATSDSISIDFSPSGVLPGAQYLWSFCDGNLMTDTLPFYYSWDTQGNYCVCVTVNNTNGCLEEFCDSTITVFDDSGIGMELQVEKLHVYPNPTSDVLNIDLTPYSEDFQLIITDIGGNEVYRKSVKGGSNFVISTSELAKGTYSISIGTTDFVAFSQFIKE